MEPSEGNSEGPHCSGSGCLPGQRSQGDPQNGQLAVFQEKVRLAANACAQADFTLAVKLYGEALQIDPRNHVLYSNRSAAYIKLGRFQRALADAVRARELSSTWPKAYYREGVALQHLNRHCEALAAFASGLSQDPKSEQMLEGLIEAALSSPMAASFEPTYRQLQAMRLDRHAFVITSVIGQELLGAQEFAPAAIVLEAALLVGSTCSPELRGSVLSALSSAFWTLNDIDKALSYMQQDLAVARAMGDTAGECRAHSNLGSAFFSKGLYKEALQSHKAQLVLAMRLNDTMSAAQALTSLGHVHTALGDLPMALASHQQCVQLVAEMGDRVLEARETGNVGAVYLAMGDFDNALQCYHGQLAIARALNDRVEEAKAYSNLGSVHHRRLEFERAASFHMEVLRISEEIQERTIEARACAGLGHAARALGDFQGAKKWYERQLDLALSTKDRSSEARALSNLGAVFHLSRDFDAALKLHQQHLRLARSLGDISATGRALGNIGKAYAGQRCHKQAIKFHKEELRVAREMGDRATEASTYGHLAMAYQALGMHEQALQHHHGQLNIAREMNDAPSEACALCNLGSCYSAKGEFVQAIPYYENFLRLSQELGNLDNETKACHFLGYAHFCLGNHADAISYYERALQLCGDISVDSSSTISGSSPETTISTVEPTMRRLKSIQNNESRQDLSRAYCNLGLARAAVGDFQAALDCQRHFLTIAQVSRDIQGKFRALGNIGDVFMRMGNGQEAVKAYQKQLALCREEESGTSLKHLEASSYSALGACHRQMKAFDRALAFHGQELQIYKELGNLQGECRAQSSLGTTHVSLGNHAEALRCYQAQLEKAKELRSPTLEVQALTNVGGMRLKLGHFDEALAMFERQAHLLESMEGSNILLERARTCGQLGECYLGLGDFKEAIERFLQFLRAALRLNSAKDKERAYKGVGNAYLSVNDFQQALMYFEKRLVVAHELGDSAIKCGAYGDLGRLHSQMGHFAQALSCLDHKMRLAQDSGDELSRAEAAASLGSVYVKMADFDRAIECHRLDLSISEQEVKDLRGQARAHGNLGTTFEAIGCFDQAIVHHEKHLELASRLKDKASKAVAYTSLGRIHHALGALAKATEYLQQGLAMAEQLGKQDEEATIRRRLAFALWAQGDLRGACKELERTVDLLEASRYTSQSESDQRATYVALQRAQVALNQHEAALATAERLRARFERVSRYERTSPHAFPGSQLTAELIVDAVDRQKAAVIYYSDAAGMLYSWLIIPQKGVVKFAETVIADSAQASGLSVPNTEGRFAVNSEDDVIARHLASLREGLGVGSGSSTRSDDDGTESDSEGFGRLRRNHLLNSSSYSLSSVFSVGSVSVASASTKPIDSGSSTSCSNNGSRPARPHWAGPPALHALYDILIAPFMDQLAGVHEIAIVPDAKLHLVPFAMLRGEDSGYLGERFSLTSVPSIAALRSGQRAKMIRRQNNDESGNVTVALVVGNPRLTPGMQKMLDLGDIPRAHEEAELVGELLTAKPMLGLEATKEAVMSQLAAATVIHIAAHVSWRLPGIVLSLGSNVLEGEHPYLAAENAEDDDEEDMPASSEFLLTPQDLMSLHLRAKLVVLSSCHTRSEHGEIREDGLNQIVRAFLAAGAQCVIVSLWPVADTAVKILYRTFYSSLLQGSKAAAALAEAMRTIQTTKQFAHPANWAGFVLIGSNVRVAYQVAAMGQALAEMLRFPERSRDALRVCLHLVEKSLQRIHRGQRNAMYTTQKSIENKVGTAATGWKELLISVGFRFEPAANNLPAAVFFPQSDPGDRLNRCSSNLQALLGLSVQTQSAIAKLMSNGDYVDDIVHLMREVVSQLERNHRGQDGGVECPVSVKLWSVPGCHELLASLGFDLMEVGVDEVTLRMGKSANSRTIEFALQALLALLDPIDPQDETHSVQDHDTSEHSDDDSLESHASLQAEPPAEFNQGPNAVARRSRAISTGDGAFTHFVRTRGEPDGLSATAAGGEIEAMTDEKRPKSSKSVWSDKSASQHIYASASSHSSASNQLDEEDAIRPRLEAFSISTNGTQQKAPRSTTALNDIYHETRGSVGLGLAPSLLNILRNDTRHAKVSPQQGSRHEIPAPPARPEGGLGGNCYGLPPEPPRVARPPPPPLPTIAPRIADDRSRTVLRNLQQNDSNNNNANFRANVPVDTEDNISQPGFMRAAASNIKRRSAIFNAAGSGATKSKDSLV